MGILDSTGALVVEYKYDAWGKLISVTGNLKDTLGKRNPFRYRGYVYDEETGLYYLRSRYYNPEIGRFINADTLLGNVGGLGSHNVYAYCANMPVVAADPSGQAAVAEGVFHNPAAQAILDALTAFLKSLVIGALAHLAKTLTRLKVRSRSESELGPALLSGSKSNGSGRDNSYNSEDYYFAFTLSEKIDADISFTSLYYINVPLTREEAKIVLASTTICNALANKYGFVGNHYGVYTDMFDTGYALACEVGACLKEDNHISSATAGPGDYYWHFDGPDHLYNIWVGGYTTKWF